MPTPSLVEAVAPLGHEGAHPGQGRWNGEAVLSRAGLGDVVRGLAADPGFPDAGTTEARTIAATCEGPGAFCLCAQRLVLAILAIWRSSGRTA